MMAQAEVPCSYLEGLTDCDDETWPEAGRLQQLAVAAAAFDEEIERHSCWEISSVAEAEFGLARD